MVRLCGSLLTYSVAVGLLLSGRVCSLTRYQGSIFPTEREAGFFVHDHEGPCFRFHFLNSIKSSLSAFVWPYTCLYIPNSWLYTSTCSAIGWYVFSG